MNISVIIPCKNEERHIARCLEALLRQKGTATYEILVVDNGSTDRTVEVLQSFGSKIQFFILPGVTISELRNFGASRAQGEWLAFVDADVEVDLHWGKSIASFVEGLSRDGIDPKNIITGSICGISCDATWIERVWYQQLVSRDAKNPRYINSGNMVMHKDVFIRIGGFKPVFTTGEEENLCREAKSLDIKLLPNRTIHAVHHGYPRNLTEFFRRMRWHGLGMREYFPKPWKSKPLMLALYNIGLLLSYAIVILFFQTSAVYWIVILLLLQFVPVILLAFARARKAPTDIPLLFFLYYIYGWAKSAAIFDILIDWKRHQKVRKA